MPIPPQMSFGHGRLLDRSAAVCSGRTRTRRLLPTRSRTLMSMNAAPGGAQIFKKSSNYVGEVMFYLTGKTIVITGGGRGIGRGIVRMMARAGGDVVLAGRTETTLEAAAAEAREFGVRAV